jgi:hypothetical protein
MRAGSRAICLAKLRARRCLRANNERRRCARHLIAPVVESRQARFRQIIFPKSTLKHFA